jgi:hypothetical protein
MNALLPVAKDSSWPAVQCEIPAFADNYPSLATPEYRTSAFWRGRVFTLSARSSRPATGRFRIPYLTSQSRPVGEYRCTEQIS